MSFFPDARPDDDHARWIHRLSRFLDLVDRVLRRPPSSPRCICPSILANVTGCPIHDPQEPNR